MWLLFWAKMSTINTELPFFSNASNNWWKKCIYLLLFYLEIENSWSRLYCIDWPLMYILNHTFLWHENKAFNLYVALSFYRQAEQLYDAPVWQKSCSAAAVWWLYCLLSKPFYSPAEDFCLLLSIDARSTQPHSFDHVISAAGSCDYRRQDGCFILSALDSFEIKSISGVEK